jgi:hypothetical protein
MKTVHHLKGKRDSVHYITPLSFAASTNHLATTVLLPGGWGCYLPSLDLLLYTNIIDSSPAQFVSNRAISQKWR